MTPVASRIRRVTDARKARWTKASSNGKSSSNGASPLGAAGYLDLNPMGITRWSAAHSVEKPTSSARTANSTAVCGSARSPPLTKLIPNLIARAPCASALPVGRIGGVAGFHGASIDSFWDLEEVPARLIRSRQRPVENRQPTQQPPLNIAAFEHIAVAPARGSEGLFPALSDEHADVMEVCLHLCLRVVDE